MEKRSGGKVVCGEVDDFAATAGELLVQPRPGVSLSRLQRTFNRLVQEVIALEGLLQAQREDFEFLLSNHQHRGAKADRALAVAQLALAAALSAANGRHSLRGHARQDLAATICSLCEDAFALMEPDAKAEALYDEWSEHSWREVMARAIAQHREASENSWAGERGEAEKPEDDESESDERRPPRRRARGEQGGGEESRPNEHPAGDFEARESRRTENEHLTRRSLREVYLALARVLHPDIVTDPSERTGREEAMKQAVAAYGHGDLLALLRLELFWLGRGGDQRGGPADDTLRAFIRALRQQAARLEDAISDQAGDPRYDAIAWAATLPRARALAEFADRAKQLRAAAAEMADLRAVVVRCDSRQDLAAIVRGARRDRER